jgi:hypothetical protein
LPIYEDLKLRKEREEGDERASNGFRYTGVDHMTSGYPEVM